MEGKKEKQSEKNKKKEKQSEENKKKEKLENNFSLSFIQNAVYL